MVLEVRAIRAMVLEVRAIRAMVLEGHGAAHGAPLVMAAASSTMFRPPNGGRKLAASGAQPPR